MTAVTEKPKSQAVALTEDAPLVVHDSGSFANLLDTGKFEHMWRVAQVFSKSGMVPKHFGGKPEACFVAIQMAVRLTVDPFMFMQNTYLSPDGKPAMEGKLAIALINARGPFKGGVQFEYSGEGDDYGCTAFGIHKADDKRRELRVDIAMAKAEGWYGRNKKWQSMQDQMLLYRAGAWLGRAYCPEVLMGMQTAEELLDLGNLRSGPDGTYVPSTTPPRPTRASVATPTTSTDDEADAANRQLDREATAVINGTGAVDETVDQSTGEVTETKADAPKVSAATGWQPAILPPLRADGNQVAWANDAIEVIGSVLPRVLPEIEEEMKNIPMIDGIHGQLARAIAARRKRS